MPFYKYQQISKYTLQNLVKQQNWIADPQIFNDPFEFRMREIYSLNNDGKLEYIKPKELEIRNYIKKNISSYGVVCYSANEHNKLLWSHYAENHRGMCLVFNVPNPLDSGLRKVEYLPNYPEINLDIEKDKAGYEIVKIVTTKSSEWSYEQEYRQVFLKKNCHEKYPGTLIEIIFGCRTPMDDMKMVASIINGIDPEIIISKMMIQKNTYLLGKSTIPSNEKPIKIPDWFEMNEF